jgi:hypothetical protein
MCRIPCIINSTLSREQGDVILTKMLESIGHHGQRLHRSIGAIATPSDEVRDKAESAKYVVRKYAAV